jgi:hypothetical protein
MGSTFTVTIPLGASPAQLTMRGTRSPYQEQSTDQREVDKVALAIDDDLDVIYFLHENLAEAGYGVVGALNGQGKGWRKPASCGHWPLPSTSSCRS